MTDTLSQYSVLALYSAMAVYAIAFVLFTIDLLGKRKLARFGMSLTILAFALQLVASVMRGIAAHRVPWANMYEFAMTGTLLIVSVYLLVNLKWDLKFLGAFITGLVLLLLGLSTTRYYVEVVPLPPALQSYWLVIHVFVASLSTGFFAIGFGLSVAQLLQQRRERLVEVAAEAKPAAKKATVGAKVTVKTTAKTTKSAPEKRPMAWLERFPDSEKLENYAYRIIIVGFVFWSFTLIAGAIWADKAWGRYWGWDTKEVWTFIIWTIYAGYIHARSTRGWRGSRSAWLAIVGFSAVMFNFTIVNIFFKGLHAYSGL